MSRLEKPQQKIIIFGAVTVLAAAIFGYGASVFGSATANYTWFFTAVIAGLIFLALFFIQTLIIKEKKLAIILIGLEVAAMIWPFLIRPSVWLIPIVLITLFFFIYAHLNGRLAMKNMVKIDFFSLRYSIMIMATLGVIFFAVTTYISTFERDDFQVSEGAIELTTRPLAPAIAKIIPNFSIDQSLQDILESTAAELHGEELEDLSGEEQDSIIQGTVNQLKELIAKMSGVKVRLDEDFVTASKNIVDGLMKNIPEKYQGTFLTFLGAAVFLLVSGGTLVINLVASLLAWLLYKLLLLTGFVYIRSNKITQEIISI